MNPSVMSAWQYERMCVGSKDWRTTDSRTARQCYENRATDMRNVTVVTKAATAGFDASAYSTGSACLNAAPASQRGACAGKP